jgi:hypothetical protein
MEIALSIPTPAAAALTSTLIELPSFRSRQEKLDLANVAVISAFTSKITWILAAFLVIWRAIWGLLFMQIRNFIVVL